MVIKIILLLLSATLAGLIGYSVISHDSRKRVNQLFSVNALSLSLWSACIALFLMTDSVAMASIWVRLYYVSAMGIGVSFYLLSKVFPQDNKLKFDILSVIGILFSLIILFKPSVIIKDIIIGFNENNTVLLNSTGYYIYSVIIGSLFITAIFNMFRIYSSSTGIVRSQAKVFLFGYFIASAIGFTFNLILPAFGNYNYIWLGPFAAFVFLYIVVYGIAKHNLFDIKLILSRSVAYFVAASTIAILYAVSTFFILDKILINQPISKHDQAILYTVFSVIFIFIFQPFKSWLEKLSISFFYKDAYNYQDLLNDINKILVSNQGTETILSKTAGLVEDQMKLEYVNFNLASNSLIEMHLIGTNKIIYSKPEWAEFYNYTTSNNEKLIIRSEKDLDSKSRKLMDSVNLEVCIKMISNNEVVGLLLIGAKKSGNAVEPNDIKLLEIIADEVAIAVQNMLRYEEIAKFNLTLQKKIDGATAELQRTNEKLKALDDAKDEFISMASHQLRTPLTSIKGYISMMLDGDAGDINDQQKGFLNQAFISSQRMVYLISDLLNVSRLKTGKFIIEKSDVFLPDVVKSELSQLEAIVDARGLKMTFDLPEDFPTLQLDETKTRQVIMNFTDNAIYYTPKGGEIKITLRKTAKTATFTVKDNGIGVPKKEQHNLFNKFYRAGNAKKARPDGTGLGLYMAKKVMIAQGGNIVFESHEGQGSTFGFSFPLGKQ